MASSGIFNWQETAFSDFGLIVSPTIFSRVLVMMLVCFSQLYTVFCLSLNLGLMSLEEELKILATTDKVSPEKTNRSKLHF